MPFRTGQLDIRTPLGQELAKEPEQTPFRKVVSDVKTGKTPDPIEIENLSKGFIEKTAKVLDTVFGGGKIGEAIGTQIAKMIVPKEQKQFISGPTPLQIAGDVVGAGLTVAGLKGVGTVGKIGARILKTMGLGAGLAASEAVSEGEDLGQVGKSAVTGGAMGAAIPVVGAGLRALGKQIQALPARFVNSALSRSKAEVLQDIAKDKVDDFAKFVVSKKPIGSANKLLSESTDNVVKINSQINEALGLAVRKGGLKTTVGVNNFLDDIVKLPEAQGALLKRPDVKNIIERLAPQTKQLLQKPSLTIEEANKLRQLVDKTLGDRAFLGGQLSSDKIILKKFADNLREVVKTKAPTGIRELFTEISNEIRFRDGLLERIAKKQGNQVLSFGDFIGGGLGGVFGSMGANPIGGAIAGVAARRAIESVPFKIGSAKAINALTKVAPVLESLAPAQQTAILNLFAEIFSKDSDTTEKTLPEEQMTKQ